MQTSRKSLALVFIAAVLAAPAIDSARAYAQGWRPFGTIEVLLSAAYLLLAVAGAAILAVPGLRRRLAVHAREAVLLLVVCLGGLALLEWGAAYQLHRIDEARNPFHTRGPAVHQRFHPDPEYLPGIVGDSTFTTDQRGIRIAAPRAGRHETRVLCIGGSTTECVYLDDTETWPVLLMDHLNARPASPPVWVGNVGISGFDTRDHLRFVRASPLMEEIDLAVFMVGINDLWRYLANEEIETRYDRFAPEAKATPADAPAPSPPTPPRPGWTRSRLIQLYHALNQTPPRPEEYEGIGGREYAIRRAQRAEAAIVETLPDLGPGLASFRERVAGLIDACAARGVQAVFVSQPVLWDEALPPEAAARCWFGWLEDGRYVSIPALRSAMDAYNAAVQHVCRARDIPVVDLSAMHGRPEFFYDDCHFTEAGARFVAEQCIDAIALSL